MTRGLPGVTADWHWRKCEEAAETLYGVSLAGLIDARWAALLDGRGEQCVAATGSGSRCRRPSCMQGPIALCDDHLMAVIRSFGEAEFQAAAHIASVPAHRRRVR